MTTQAIYDADWAANYQSRTEAAIPGREGLYRLCCAAFRSVPPNARFLVVGCGTGEELLWLARTFPLATFVGIDPAEAMLEVCARRVAQAQLDDRVELHAAMLDSISPEATFDAATAILVSQHIEADADAQAFFHQLAAHLRPGGRLYCADLHIGNRQHRDAMLNLWREQALMSGIESDSVDGMLARFRSDIRPRDEALILEFLERAGFTDVLKPFSALLYGAWTGTKRAAV